MSKDQNDISLFGDNLKIQSQFKTHSTLSTNLLTARSNQTDSCSFRKSRNYKTKTSFISNKYQTETFNNNTNTNNVFNTINSTYTIASYQTNPTIPRTITSKNKNQPLKTFHVSNSISYKERNLIRNVPRPEIKFDLPVSEYALPQFHKKVTDEEDVPIKHNTIRSNSTNLGNINSNILVILSKNIHKILEKQNTKEDNGNQNKYKITEENNDVKQKTQSTKKTRPRYTLKYLMELNPYHLVDNKVKFSPLLNNMFISPKLNAYGGSMRVQDKPASYRNRIFEEGTFKSLSRTSYKLNSRKNNSHSNDYASTRYGLLNRLLVLSNKISISNNFRNVIIYEAIKLLWNQYSITIEKLIIYYKKYKWFLEKKEKISKKVFREFLEVIKLEKTHSSFSDKVYLIFDSLKTGFINIKEFFFLMKLTGSNLNYYSKISFIVEILVDIHYGKGEKINIAHIVNLFKSIIPFDNYKKEIKKLNDLIKSEFYNNNVNEDVYITKAQCFTFLEGCNYIKLLINRFENNYQNSSVHYEEELMNVFKANMRHSKYNIANHEIVERIPKEIEKYNMILQSIIGAKASREKVTVALGEDNSIEENKKPNKK